MPAQILLVDDDPASLDVLKRYLSATFDVLTAASGADGLDVVRGNSDLAVVVSDQRMPAMDGITFLDEVSRAAPDAIRIVLTGYAELEMAIEADGEFQLIPFALVTIVKKAYEQQSFQAETSMPLRSRRGFNELLPYVVEVIKPRLATSAGRRD